MIEKGMYLWSLQNCEGGDPTLIARTAKTAGFNHVLLKIQDGTYAYNQIGSVDADQPLLALIKALQGAGISVWGWGYVYGESPSREGDRTIERMKALDLNKFVINAEREYKHRSSQAVMYMNIVKAALPKATLGLSSYRYPSLHPEFPWREFIGRVDVIMPQVYWLLANNPGMQLKRCVEEYKRFPIRPMIPTGCAFKDNQNVDHSTGEYWKPTANQIKEFIDTISELNLAGYNFWEWSNCRKHCPELWNVISWGSLCEQPGDPEMADPEPVSAVETLQVRAYRPTESITSYLSVRQGPGVTFRQVDRIQPADVVYELERKVLKDGSIWIRIGHRQWAAVRYRRLDGTMVDFLR